MRKADDRRKRARESRAERHAAVAAVRQEEVRRLKAIKRREIEERCASNWLPLGATCSWEGCPSLGAYQKIEHPPLPGCGLPTLLQDTYQANAGLFVPEARVLQLAQRPVG